MANAPTFRFKSYRIEACSRVAVSRNETLQQMQGTGMIRAFKFEISMATI